jgi:signal transduction histidine kinase
MAHVPHSEFARIAAHLRQSRDSVLECWRRAVDKDPRVGVSAALVRSQFLDHIPRILDAFDHALRARSARSEAAAEAEELAGAAEHGEHRWLHGYNSRETLREWGHLHLCLVAELEALASSDANIDAFALSESRTMLAQLFVDCMVESAASHAALERAAAEVRLRDLQVVLEHLRSLERDRTELWREAAHDLRGNVGAVKLAANALGQVGTPEMPAFAGLVRKSADSLDRLLNDLIELARLEAGREQLNVTAFDVSKELGGLCDSLQPLAASRRLSLTLQAPGTLIVDGDAVKVRRIAQNIILNALKYTEDGAVVVSCAETTGGDGARWVLRVQDTGVGLENHEAPQAAPTASAEHPGEGVGLSIVKRLCDLLDASLELETEPGRGTTFAIVFPRHYSSQ